MNNDVIKAMTYDVIKQWIMTSWKTMNNDGIKQWIMTE